MSEFDKEAEREKLREQFAEDDRKRETTQRMSELLLKGATMTNKHCDDCGDPIFRWQGEEFCPTCSAAEGTRVKQAAQQAQQAEESQQSPDSASASETPEQEGSVDASNGAPPNPESVPGHADAQVDVQLGPEEDVPGEAATGGQDAPSPTDRASPAPPTREPTPPTAPEPSAPGQFADLSDARESLGRTVTRFAREAESADDLARAREYLTAVEDAADALAAVRRAER
ncbi:Sjogren's syndrome/scleroderma autoantigen 1 family protein [Halomarina litorea]|uniref:Sjogren's syndrome/scleroderma autoantigen 1 family protein n=1 Tax=Halomarina litorea TaxID=2961595 RepID=UPI0020C3ABC3|nr:Sjogren's syndrome/scleroderma autoantigen 1 family protein [Halomarina sp. BCD28]